MQTFVILMKFNGKKKTDNKMNEMKKKKLATQLKSSTLEMFSRYAKHLYIDKQNNFCELGIRFWCFYVAPESIYSIIITYFYFNSHLPYLSHAHLLRSKNEKQKEKEK